MHGRKNGPRTAWSWLQRWGIDVIWTVGIFAGLGVAQAYLKDRPLGRFFRNFEYVVLEQTLLAETTTGADAPENELRLPIVVDISHVPLTDGHTDRGMLRKMVASLQKHHAAAIGVDVDFSPDEDGLITPEDGKILGEWKDMNNVVVGVFRQEGQLPARWLGHPDFRSLAAGMMVPKHDTGYAYQYTSPDQSIGRVGPADYLLQMPAALFAVLHPGSRESLVESSRLTPADVKGRLAIGKYAVDYSSLDRIKSETIISLETGIPEETIDRVAGRVVLVGDTQDAHDTYFIAVSQSPVAGVWIHASSFATLNRSLGARHIDESTSRFYDAVLLLGVLVLMACVRFGASDRVNRESVDVMLFSGAAFAVVCWSVVIVKMTNVFWPDFLWVSGALFIQPYLKQIGGMVVRGVKGVVSGAATA